MKNIMKKWGLVLLVLVFVISAAGAQTLTIVTEELAPLSYTNEKGEVVGFSSEIVKRLLREVNMKGEIQSLPWARAYNTALKKENVLIFSIARDEKREKEFKWVGVIADYSIYFYGLKSRPEIKVSSIEQAKKYTVGTVIDDFREEYLIDKGFVKDINLFPVYTDSLNINKLTAKRIDLWPVNDLTASYIAKEKRISFELIEKKFTMIEIPLYLAFSNETSDTTVKKFVSALEKIKKKNIKNI